MSIFEILAEILKFCIICIKLEKLRKKEESNEFIMDRNN